VPALRCALAPLAALVLAVVVAGCGQGSPLQARATDTETLSVDVPAGSWAALVRVEMFNGPIQVRAGAPGEVSAVVTTTGTGTTQADAESDRQQIQVTLDANPDGTVLLRAVYQPNPSSPENRSASAVVTVPAAASLDLRTSNGAVTVADVTGAIDVRTSNGAVTLADAPAGSTVRTSNGAVEIAGGGLLDVESSNGRVRIFGTDATVRAVTSNADLTFEGTFSGGAQGLETSNGPITVRLPAGSSFGLDAQTSNGSVTVDGFDIRTTGVVDDDTLQGTVGTGGPSVVLRTSNASIVIAAE
jgi:DUF4097 and DUF4098 domain-containing protein YvlB